jgi:hypothetical protein
MTESDLQLTFDGSNWEDLDRLVTQATIASILDEDLVAPRARSAWLGKHFAGPALDWLGTAVVPDGSVLNNFDDFVWLVRNTFGVTAQGLHAHRRSQLEGLKWMSDLPVFFAEFDRLTIALGIGGNDARIALLRGKLPTQVQKLLAEQALDFADYGTMRERLLTMWALDPNKHTAVGSSTKPKKTKCGRCGKKGHAAPDCRSAKN